MWEAVATGIQRLLMMNNGISDIATADAAFGDQCVTDLLNKKAEEGGPAYSQMNKLALFAVGSEKEIEHLRDRVAVLEETIQRLEDERSLGRAHRGLGSLSASLYDSSDSVVTKGKGKDLAISSEFSAASTSMTTSDG
jgi:uncharacterized small protein (DUF1192 family)